MKKKLNCLLVCLLVAAMLVACGGTGTTSGETTSGTAASGETAAQTEGTADSGKILRVSMAGAPTDINPLTASTAEGSELLGCMYEGLVRQNAEGQILPGSVWPKSGTSPRTARSTPSPCGTPPGLMAAPSPPISSYTPGKRC